jgi:hypothetical protein
MELDCKMSIRKMYEAYLLVWMSAGIRWQDIGQENRPECVYHRADLAQARLGDEATRASLQSNKLTRDIVSNALCMQQKIGGRLWMDVADMQWAAMPLKFRDRPRVAKRLTSALFDLMPWLLLLPAPVLAVVQDQLQHGRCARSAKSCNATWPAWASIVSALPSEVADTWSEHGDAVARHAKAARDELVLSNWQRAFHILKRHSQFGKDDLRQEAGLALTEICYRYARTSPPPVDFYRFMVGQLRDWPLESQ